MPPQLGPRARDKRSGETIRRVSRGGVDPGRGEMAKSFNNFACHGLALAACAVVLLGATAPASAASLSISSNSLEEYASRLGLSSTQLTQVNQITQSLIAESNDLFRKHGVAIGECSGKRPAELSDLNRDVTAAYFRAKIKLRPILNVKQLQEYTRIYEARREAVKNQILCQ